MEFLNAIKVNQENPETFLLFDDNYFSELKQLDNVRVCLNDERFWVTVISIDLENRKIKGFVNNDLILNNLKYEDNVEISFDNVLDIYFPIVTTKPEAVDLLQSIGRQNREFNNLRKICNTCNEPTFLKVYEQFFK